MTHAEANRELYAFDEKITLAKLEVAKAYQRVAELKYAKTRFALDYQVELCKQGAGQP